MWPFLSFLFCLWFCYFYHLYCSVGLLALVLQWFHLQVMKACVLAPSHLGTGFVPASELKHTETQKNALFCQLVLSWSSLHTNQRVTLLCSQMFWILPLPCYSEPGTHCFYWNGWNVVKQNSTRALITSPFSVCVPFFVCFFHLVPISNKIVQKTDYFFFSHAVCCLYFLKELQKFRETHTAYWLSFIPGPVIEIIWNLPILSAYTEVHMCVHTYLHVLS